MALRERVAPICARAIQPLRLLLVQLDATSIRVHYPKVSHRHHVPELHSALPNLRGFLIGFHKAEVTIAVRISQSRNRFRHLVLHMAAKTGELLRGTIWAGQTTWIFIFNITSARLPRVVDDRIASGSTATFARSAPSPRLPLRGPTRRSLSRPAP